MENEKIIEMLKSMPTGLSCRLKIGENEYACKKMKCGMEDIKIYNAESKGFDEGYKQAVEKFKEWRKEQIDKYYLIKDMNYQKIKLIGGAEVNVDFDVKQTSCKKCGKLIMFAITEKSGKFIPIIKVGENYQAHFADCKFAAEFRGNGVINNRIEAEGKNQEYLNE